MTQSTAALTPMGSLPDKQSTKLTYGRARLLLGISGVGTWVLLAVGVLMTALPAWLAGITHGNLGADALIVVALSLVVIAIQAPFDVLGGYLLPRRHGRTTQPVASIVWRWLRGVAAYQGVYLLLGLMLLVASRGLGPLGMVLVGIAASMGLLAVRTPLAALVGGLSNVGPNEAAGDDAAMVASSDSGFTGGIEGVFRARRQLVPHRWINTLSPEMLSLAMRRRREAATSGLWLRGRVLSLAFILVGLAIAGTQVGELAGTSGGVLTFAAVFTLWSFLGLLFLPTLSRRASIAVDQLLVRDGVDPVDLSALAAALDAMQDGEPSRPKWIERVFHPIPNVTSRNRERTSARLGGWDVARTSAFLGMSGLSPLGRAVHCNSGRPSLWVYLPLD